MLFWRKHIMNEQGHYAEAEPLYKRALVIKEKALGPDHPDVALTLFCLAENYAGQGLYADAEPLLRRALDIRTRMLGINHPDVAKTLNRLSLLADRTKQPKLALEYARKGTSAVLAHAAIEASDTRQPGKTGGLVEQRRSPHQHRRRRQSRLARRAPANRDPEAMRSVGLSFAGLTHTGAAGFSLGAGCFPTERRVTWQEN
jgi:tetratricopeptide (TPR) repeat protein